MPNTPPGIGFTGVSLPASLSSRSFSHFVITISALQQYDCGLFQNMGASGYLQAVAFRHGQQNWLPEEKNMLYQGPSCRSALNLEIEFYNL